MWEVMAFLPSACDGGPLPVWPGYVVSPWGASCLRCSRGGAGTSSVAVPHSISWLNLPWDWQLVLGRATLSIFFALAKKNCPAPLPQCGGMRITRSLGSLAPAPGSLSPAAAVIVFLMPPM